MLKKLSRRDIIGAAAAGTALVTGAYAQNNVQSSNPITPIAGPQNPPLDKANPDSFNPPHTDNSDEPSFKYSFGLGHNRVSQGGWARQVTVRDFPISKEMAGVDMRLERGAIRELHWHVPSEWAYMLSGSARITSIDLDGRSFVSDVKHGDLWYFPSGLPHSIQGLGDDGCEFLLVFDDGAFSEFDTFLISDWMMHTPPEVLSKNFNVPASTFNGIPKKELYIFPAQVPPPLAQDVRAAQGSRGAAPERFDYAMLDQKPTKVTKSGEVRIVDSSSFTASKTIAAALVTVHPGGIRELHWHPNADEWQYYIQGKGRMTVFGGSGRARTMDFDPGDVGYVLRSLGHYVENTGNTDLVFLEMFRTAHYQDLSLSDWITHTPPELITEHLHLDRATIDAFPHEKQVIVPA